MTKPEPPTTGLATEPATPTTPTPTPTTVADELAAMRRIVATLDKLDDPASDRVVNWMYDRYRREGDR